MSKILTPPHAGELIVSHRPSGEMARRSASCLVAVEQSRVSSPVAASQITIVVDHDAGHAAAVGSERNVADPVGLPARPLAMEGQFRGVAVRGLREGRRVGRALSPAAGISGPVDSCRPPPRVRPSGEGDRLDRRPRPASGSRSGPTSDTSISVQGTAAADRQEPAVGE